MNSRRVDLAGHVYGRWTVLGFSRSAPGSMMWNCRCECGVEREVSANNFRSGKSRSCGCLQTEMLSDVRFKHGQTEHPIYNSWAGAKNRCYNLNDQDYKYYGGRGIRVCDRWIADFWNFWDDMASGWRPGLTIERKNVNGNYEPSNCCWLSIQDQQSNKRNSKN